MWCVPCRPRVSLPWHAQVNLDKRQQEHQARLAAAEEEERARTLDPEAFSSGAVAGHNTSMEDRVRGNRFFSQRGGDGSGFLKK